MNPRTRVVIAQDIIDKAREDLAALYGYPSDQWTPPLSELIQLVNEDAEAL